ncbi:unnamed protein product [Malus baccata var. baccata]
MVEWPSVELGSAGLSRKSSVICSDLRYFSLILTKSKIRNRNMSALFNFNSFLTVVLLVICTCTFVKMQFPAVLEQKTGSVVSLPHCFSNFVNLCVFIHFNLIFCFN